MAEGYIWCFQISGALWQRRGSGDYKERAKALLKGSMCTLMYIHLYIIIYIHIYSSLCTGTVLRNFEYPCGCKSSNNWYLVGTARRQIVPSVHYSEL